MGTTRSDVARLVERWRDGDPDALAQLIEVAYDDLRHIASTRLNGWRGAQTLETTGLVNELYLRLADSSDGVWGGRAEFFSFCSKAMRSILVDYARKKGATKRGGDVVLVPLDEGVAGADDRLVELIALDEALDALAERDARMARIVECRFFGGLSVPETAAVVGASPRTVEREWARARAYLELLLSSEQTPPPAVDP